MVPFGCSTSAWRRVSNEGLTQTGDVVGTLRYMAPERFQGDDDARADIYSLGLTLYELCTLRPAFDETDRVLLMKQLTTQVPPEPRRIERNIPRDLETIILKAIEREPHRRYKTAQQMAEDLRLFLMDHPITARRISPFERAARTCRRNPLVSSLAFALAVLLVVIAIGSSRFAYVSNQKTKHAVNAEKATRLRRYELSYQNARSMRKSAQTGRRFEALRSIKEAVELLPKLGFSRERVEREKALLRTEAVAAMALFDLREERSWPVNSHHGRVVCFSPGYQFYAQINNENHDIQIRHVDDAEPGRTIHCKYEQIHEVWFNPSGKYVCSSHPNKNLCVWTIGGPEMNLKEPLIETIAHNNGRLVFSKHDDFAAIGCPEGVRIYDLRSADVAVTIPADFRRKLLAFSESERQIAIADFLSRSIEVWDFTDEPRRIWEITTPEELASVTAIAWSSVQDTLVAGLNDGELLVWRNGFDQQPETFDLHKHTITRLRFHPHKSKIFSHGWDDTTRIFDLATEKQLLRLEGFNLLYNDVSPDGKKSGLSSRDDDSVAIWHLPTSHVRHFRLDLNELPAADVHRRAHTNPKVPGLLATAHAKKTEIWNVLAGQKITDIVEHETPFVEFSRDGRFLLMLSDAGCKRLPIAVSQFGYRVSSKLDVTVDTATAETILGPQPGASKLAHDSRSGCHTHRLQRRCRLVLCPAFSSVGCRESCTIRTTPRYVGCNHFFRWTMGFDDCVRETWRQGVECPDRRPRSNASAEYARYFLGVQS